MYSFRYQIVYLGNLKMMFLFLFFLLVNVVLSRELEKFFERYFVLKNVIQFIKEDYSNVIGILVIYYDIMIFSECVVKFLMVQGFFFFYSGMEKICVLMGRFLLGIFFLEYKYYIKDEKGKMFYWYLLFIILKL